MSDYGDDYSDYGEEWMYVEEEYMIADDLAEHAVQSPPPTSYDEVLLEDWDRFDYFNDLEYASDGYDDAKFKTHKGNGDGVGAERIGQKRKRGATPTRSRKQQKLDSQHAIGQGDATMLTNSPVVWRSQADRSPEPRLLTENAKPVALLKDWREKLADTPPWAKQSPRSASAGPDSLGTANDNAAVISAPESHEPQADAEDEEDAGIDPTALMAVLQERLAAAGGPLSGMDPEQLLQFAMRMATGEGEGEDIAGEMADELLNQGDEEAEDEDIEANLLSWVAQQRTTSDTGAVDDTASAITSATGTSQVSRNGKRLPTPPSSEANRSVLVGDENVGVVEGKVSKAATSEDSTAVVGQASRKRKADDAADSEDTTNSTKKRATRSFDAPTAASQARAVAPKTTRSGRVKR